MADSVTSIYLEDPEVEFQDSDDEQIVFHNGACVLAEPTNDTRADQIGKDLQESETILTSLHLNYSDWTQWGAHEICNYMRESSSLREVTLQFEKGRDGSITSTRTLAALGEALASNANATIQQLRLFWVKLQTKSVAPLCQFLKGSTTLEKLVLVDVIVDGPTCNYLAGAISASPSLKTLSFFNASNTIIRTILQGMSLGCPASFRLLEMERSSRALEEDVVLDTDGLEALLNEETCPLEQLKFNTIKFGRESMEGLHRGLANNHSVKVLTFRECPIYEPVLELVLQDMSSVHTLQLDCFPLQDGLSSLRALQTNTSVTHCELFNLPLDCGRVLRDILAQNRTLQSLKLNNADRVLANPQVDLVEADAIETIAEGLRVNSALQSLTLKALGLNDDGIGYLAAALVGPDPALDLTLEWDYISIEGLDHFSRVLRDPRCRLRHLQLELEDTNNISLNAGMVRFIEGAEQSPHLESVYLEPSTEDEGLAPPVFARLAHAFLRSHTLKKFFFLFSMDNERGWREMDPKIITLVQTDLFVGLAKNYSLEHLQFADAMYTSQTEEDKEFWRDVSYFGMRNRLLKGLDTGTIADEITSVSAGRSLAQNMVMEEIATRKPWTLRRWQEETNPVHHELNELSLFFLCLQHLPHLLRAGPASCLSQQRPPLIPLMELD